MDLLGDTGPPPTEETYYSLTTWNWWQSQQATLSIFDRIAQAFGQLISAKKIEGHGYHAGTEPGAGGNYSRGGKLEVVEESRYVGSFEHETGSMSCEMASRKTKRTRV